MTSVSSTNSAALLILQQTGSVANASASAAAHTDLVKIVNGVPAVSSEPAKASIQAAAAAGKLALDNAAPEPDANGGGHHLSSNDHGLSARTTAAGRAEPATRFTEGSYQISTDDGGLAARMAAASNAGPVRRSEKELIEMMGAFDALSAKFGLEPLHPNMRANTLKNGTW